MWNQIDQYESSYKLYKWILLEIIPFVGLIRSNMQTIKRENNQLE